MCIAQRSMFLYTLRITPRGLFAIMNLPGKTAIEEKISRKALDSTPCKLSMIVRIAKAACWECSWVWFFDSMKLGTREVAKEAMNSRS